MDSPASEASPMPSPSTRKVDRDILLQDAVGRDGLTLGYTSPERKKDRDFVMRAVKRAGNALFYASSELKDDRDIVMEAVKQDGSAMKHASTKLKNDRTFILQAIKKDWRALEFVPSKFKDDRQIVTAAVRQNGWALEHASTKLKDDIRVVQAAIEGNACQLQFASENMRGDKTIVMEAAKKDWHALYHLAQVATAPENVGFWDGSVLQFASEKLKEDSSAYRKIVMEAVQQNWYALQFMSVELRSDEEIVMTAVKTNWQTLRHASDTLKKDLPKYRTIVLEAVKQDWHALLQCDSPQLLEDRKILLEAVKQDWRILLHCKSQDLITDHEIVMTAVKQDWRFLAHVSQQLKNNAHASDISFRDIVLEAVKQDWHALLEGGDDIKADPEIVTVAVRQDWHALFHASQKLESNLAAFREIVIEAAKQDRYALLHFARGKLKDDRELFMAAVALDESSNVEDTSLEFASDVLKKDSTLKRLVVSDKKRLESVHIAATEGYVFVLRALISAAVSVDDLEELLGSSINPRMDTPLHVAARHGHLDACKILVDSGAPAFLLNKNSQMPVDLAAEGEHKDIVQYFTKLNAIFHLGWGDGNGLDDALSDDRFITAVSWAMVSIHSMLSPDDSSIPVNSDTFARQNFHSFIVLTVTDRATEANEKSELDTAESKIFYIIEKCDGPSFQHEDMVKTPKRKRDIFVSKTKIQNYRDVVTVVAELNGEELQNDLKLKDLYELATSEKQLPFDPNLSNSHFMAQLLFNSCATEASSKRVERIPNERLVAHDLQRTLSEMFPFKEDKTTNRQSNDLAALCAQLASWNDRTIGEVFIATEGLDVLSDSSTSPEHTVESSPTYPVDWAIVSSETTVFVVFKGYKSFFEAAVDFGSTSIECPLDRKLAVDGSLWNVLHSAGKTNVISALMNALKANANELVGRRLVVCGHSRSGGLALLAALELLHHQLEVSEVLAFGAPKCIKPEYSSKLWLHLNRICTVYINDWDIMPRLPSHIPWISKVLHSEMKRKSGSNPPEYVCRLGSVPDLDFHHVGDLMFIGAGRLGMMRVLTYDPMDPKVAALAEDWLKKTPEKPGPFIIGHHMTYPEVTSSLDIFVDPPAAPLITPTFRDVAAAIEESDQDQDVTHTQSQKLAASTAFKASSMTIWLIPFLFGIFFSCFIYFLLRLFAPVF